MTMANEENPESVEFGWLEEIHGAAALEWVAARNAETLARVKDDPRFARAERISRSVPTIADRISVACVGGYLHRISRAPDNPAGIWQRASLESLTAGRPEWRDILDLRNLPKIDGRTPIWRGVHYAEPVFCPDNPSRCLMRLSPDGGDKSALREFDVDRGMFIEDGFNVDQLESSLSVQWNGIDQILLTVAFAPEERSPPGFPIVIREWQRGTPLSQAKLILPPDKDTTILIMTGENVPGTKTSLITRMRDYTRIEVWSAGGGETPTLLPFPHQLAFEGIAGCSGDHVIFTVSADSNVCGTPLAAGSLASFNITAWRRGDTHNLVSIIFEPGIGKVVNKALGSIASTTICTPDRIWYSILDHVRPELFEAVWRNGNWHSTPIALPDWHNVMMSKADHGRVIAIVQSLIDPPVVNLLEPGGKWTALIRQAAMVDLSGYRQEQRFATSKDGARVPYFLITPKEAVGPQPTMVYAYGGFGIGMTLQYFGPGYGGDALPAWLDAGGSFVIANIRGGDELGPQWHQTARGATRQRSYDDFFAVAEDLVKAGITTPNHLAATGVSNGGLLAGVALTQRPDLFRAILAGVPLADMLRFHKLLAGPAWIPEYGDPEDPEAAKWLRAYSPFHNVKEGMSLPEPLYYTSAADDRVHPGHSRRMVAKLRAHGHAALLFETGLGGHGGMANPAATAELAAIEATYLMQKTGLGTPS